MTGEPAGHSRPPVAPATTSDADQQSGGRGVSTVITRTSKIYIVKPVEASENSSQHSENAAAEALVSLTDGSGPAASSGLKHASESTVAWDEPAAPSVLNNAGEDKRHRSSASVMSASEISFVEFLQPSAETGDTALKGVDSMVTEPMSSRGVGSASATTKPQQHHSLTPSWTPLANLKGWRKLKRLVRHYVRFFMAFETLWDVNSPWQMDPLLLKRMEVLGEGCFAVCSRYQTIREGHKHDIAMKLLKPGASDQDVDDFIRERDLLQKLRHSRVVQFYDSGHIQLEGMNFPELYLGMEFMSGGSVRDMILKQMDNPHRRIYTKSDALRWLLDIAKALKYLHTRSPRVIHRDLKPENIMLSHKTASLACAKLADFGLHCLVEKDGAMPDDVYELTGNTGSLMYMSPEVFRLEPYNEKADVFSFAVNFWELFSCSLMIARITNLGTQEEVYNYACGVSNGMRPLIPGTWPQEIATLITDCWDPFPENRPDFSQIVQRLSLAQDTVASADRASGSSDCCCSTM